VFYTVLPSSFPSEDLFRFNKTYGSTPLNFIPDAPVQKHFAAIKTGETVVWGAFVNHDASGGSPNDASFVDSEGNELVGLISSAESTGYWVETTKEAVGTPYFINEFVVNPNLRGKGIGKMLTSVSVDRDMGIWSVLGSRPLDGSAGDRIGCNEQYTTVHVDNVASRAAFIKGGYSETITYEDALRDRDTTVLKCSLLPSNDDLKHLPAELEKIGTSTATGSWRFKGIDYRRVQPGEMDPEALFQFNKTHGTSPLNFIPDGPVREHFNGIVTGDTIVWGSYAEGKLVGLITAARSNGYWLQTEREADYGGKDLLVAAQQSEANIKNLPWFINEFAVDPSQRGKGIGKLLTAVSVDEELGIFAFDKACAEMYTTVHVDNIASRTAFIAGNYEETLTYADAHRDRDTTVLKFRRPEGAKLLSQFGQSDGAFAHNPLLQCSGCGAVVDCSHGPVFKCPNANSKTQLDHILFPVMLQSGNQRGPEASGLTEKQVQEMFTLTDAEDVNPFTRFKPLLFSYHLARHLGISDADYDSIVSELSTSVKEVDPVGSGFARFSPLQWVDGILPGEKGCFLKNETVSVAQCHKGRHLFGMMLTLQVLARREDSSETKPDMPLRSRRLAVASCGNAGLSAAVVAAATKWPIDVFVPVDASPAVLNRLEELGATVTLCPTEEHTVVEMCKVVEEQGAIPFTVQGNENGLALDGQQTLIWEAIAQLKQLGEEKIGHLTIQCGGGALGSGVIHGLRKARDLGALDNLPRVDGVQADGCFPLMQAMDKLRENPASYNENAVQQAMKQAAQNRSNFMQPWHEPTSIAHGILDAETYDWVNFCTGMLETGASGVKVSDADVIEACHLVRADTSSLGGAGIYACHTGCSGVAGMRKLKSDGVTGGEGVDVCIISGMERS
jgi:threonine synthase